MKRVALYTRSGRSRPPDHPHRDGPPATAGQNDPSPATASASVPSHLLLLRDLIRRHDRIAWAAVAGLLALIFAWGPGSKTPVPQKITQKHIERAVIHALETQTLPSPARRAYDAVIPSVVRVRGLTIPQDGNVEIEKNVGTGVVLVDSGIILTNLHVVLGAERVEVVFADGLESDAELVGLKPDNDLAVLQAKIIPDDLAPANLGSTRDLAPGDQVIAVGFPFGIGPSVSAGVVSGLNREYRSPEGRAPADQSHPVRRGSQPRQLRRAAGERERRGGGHRHRHSESHGAARVHRCRVCRDHGKRGWCCRLAAVLRGIGRSRHELEAQTNVTRSPH
jgi:hypothetical protein